MEDFKKLMINKFFKEGIREEKYPSIDVKNAYYDIQDFIFEVMGFIKVFIDKFFRMDSIKPKGYEELYNTMKEEVE